MLKKFISLFVALVLVLCLGACSSEEASPLPKSKYISSEVDKKTTITYDVYEDYVIITGSLSPLSALVVPEKMDGKEVKAIRADAFRDMTTLTAFKIANTVVEIGDSAFYGCTNLQVAVLSENLQKIGSSAFYHNDLLESIHLPNTLQSIGAHAFADCARLKNINVGKNVKSIGGGAFAGTKWLADKKDEFVVAGDNVLIHYNGTDEKVTIPDDIREVSAFCDNFYVKEVVFPESAETIGEYCFFNSALTKFEKGENITSIRTSAFDSCLELKKVEIGSKVKTIGDFAFTNCKSLEKVTIPENVRSIGNNVFSRCEGLKTITFESGKTEIGTDILDSCSSIEKVICPSKSPVVDYAKEEKFVLDII